MCTLGTMDIGLFNEDTILSPTDQQIKSKQSQPNSEEKTRPNTQANVHDQNEQKSSLVGDAVEKPKEKVENSENDVKPKDEVVVPEYSFLMYRIYSKIVGAKVVFAKEINFKVI